MKNEFKHEPFQKTNTTVLQNNTIKHIDEEHMVSVTPTFFSHMRHNSLTYTSYFFLAREHSLQKYTCTFGAKVSNLLS